MKKSLILIDFINDICNSQGKIAGCAQMINEQQISQKVNHLLDFARQNDWFIVWIIVGFDKNYHEANLKSPIFKKAKEFKALARGEWGTQIISDLNYNDGELIICKNAVNPFHGTNLDHVLRSNSVDEVYIAGVSTEVAVQSCVRDAHDRGYVVNLINDCCASGNIARHNASLEMLSYMATVIPSTQIVISDAVL